LSAGQQILVVDDDTAITDIVAEILREAGYVAVPADSAAAAYRALDEADFQLVIVDYLLPDELGSDFARHARGRGAAVILISGEPRAIEALPVAGFRLLQKPFRTAELLREVGDAIEEVRPASLS
jgi:DNA-binding response OmpR family regulator